MAYVLIVDDDVDFAEAVATVVRGLGHETEVRHRITGVLDEIAARMPDLLILDVMFPEEKSGGARIARQAAGAHPELPILLVTAVNTHQPLGFSAADDDAQALPVAGFLEKPVDLDVLAKEVARLVRPDS